MHNESKLGLLAGVGGVVAAAVLLIQNPSMPAPAESAKNAVPAVERVPVVVKPVPASTPIASRSRPEIEAKTTSRQSDSDDDE